MIIKYLNRCNDNASTIRQTTSYVFIFLPLYKEMTLTKPKVGALPFV